MKRAYFGLDLAQLSEQNFAAHLDNEIVLIDNLDDDETVGYVDYYFAKYPVKLSFNLFIICTKGEFRIRINLQEHELRAGDGIIVQQGSIGEFLSIGNGTLIALMAFAPHFTLGTSHIDHEIQLQQQIFASPFMHLSDAALAEFMTIYRLMKAKIGERDNPFRKDALLGYTQVLVSCAYNYILKAKPSGEMQNRSQELYTRFMQLVQQHFRSERGIAFYADQLCVTPKYLSQQVHRVSGRFAGDWIREYVILEAKALLKSRHYTVQQVADHLNFPSQSFFGKYFKNATGLSPTEFRTRK